MTTHIFLWIVENFSLLATAQKGHGCWQREACLLAGSLRMTYIRSQAWGWCGMRGTRRMFSLIFARLSFSPSYRQDPHPPLLQHCVRRRGDWPVLHSQALERVLPQLLHHGGLRPVCHGHPAWEAHVHQGMGASATRLVLLWACPRTIIKASFGSFELMSHILDTQHCERIFFGATC